MLILFGFRSYVRSLAVLTFICTRCGNPAAHRVVQYTRKFTLFFVPLFPISTRHSMTCTFCGETTPLTREQADELVAHAAGGPLPVAGTAVPPQQGTPIPPQ